MALREDLLKLAEEMASAAPETLRLAHNEKDATTDEDKEAAHFLKIDGQRCGRDIELYGFMGTVQGDWNAVVDFTGEVVLRMRTAAPAAYEVAAARMKEFGRAHLDADKTADWDALFEDVPSTPAP
jgi:hypothetical protein